MFLLCLFKKRLELLHILGSVCDINAVKAAAQFVLLTLAIEVVCFYTASRVKLYIKRDNTANHMADTRTGQRQKDWNEIKSVIINHTTLTLMSR